MSFPLEAAAARAGLDGSRPNLVAFFEDASMRAMRTGELWTAAVLTLYSE